MDINICGKDTTLLFMDTETHADIQLQEMALEGKEVRECGIWLGYCIDGLESDYRKCDSNMFTNWEQWLEIVKGYARSKNTIIYDYNLAFEWSYLKFALFRWGFQPVVKRCKEDHHPQFSVLSSGPTGATIYSIRIWIEDYYDIEIRDLRKVIGSGSLRQTCRDFGLGDDGKKEFDDYEKFRRIPNYIPTEQEKEYCFFDCYSMSRITQHFIDEAKEKRASTKILRTRNYSAYLDGVTDEDDEGMEFFTSVSAASFSAKRIINECFEPKIAVRKTEKKTAHGTHRIGEESIITAYHRFRDLYPSLDEADETTKAIRASYQGGICTPTYCWGNAKIVGNIDHLDVNSMYPSQVACRRLPYGRPHRIKRIMPPTDGKMRLYKLKFAYDELNFVPNIWWTHVTTIWDTPIHISLEYDVRDDDPKKLYVIYAWDFELETYRRCLENFRIEFLDGWEFKASAPGKNPLAKYFIEHFEMKAKYKQEGKDALKAMEKMFINSPTGKFGERPHPLDFIPTMKDGHIWFTSRPSEKVDKCQRYTYIPLISAITAWGRYTLIDLAYRIGFENIAYCDTDSLFVVDPDGSILEKVRSMKNDIGENMISNRMLAWDLDRKICCATFAKPKAYSYCELSKTGWEWQIKAGGVNNPDPLLGDLLGSAEGFAVKSRQMCSTASGNLMLTKTKVLKEGGVRYQASSELEVLDAYCYPNIIEATEKALNKPIEDIGDTPRDILAKRFLHALKCPK